MKLRLAGILLLLFPCQAFSFYALTSGCEKAYSAIWQFRISDALSIIGKERADNGVAIHLSETAYFIKAFATEAPDDIRDFNSENKLASSFFNDDGSAWYYYCKAEACLHSALIGMKQNQFLTPAYDINKAYGLLNTGAKKYPAFLPIQKDLLLLQAAIGAVPDNYRWMVKILGFSGDLKQSAATYDNLIRNLHSDKDYSIYEAEASIFNSYLHFYLLNDAEGAWNAMNAGTTDYARSPIMAFLRSSMALRLKKNREAAQTLSATAAASADLPLLDYEYGLVLIEQCNKAAGAYFARFIENYRGVNYLKDAYLRMGWAFLLNKDSRAYRHCMDLVKNHGSTFMEEDGNAQKEASREEIPNLNLLRARLYYDGGDYKSATQALGAVSPAKLGIYNQAEYYYRRGRVAEGLGNLDEALGFYAKLIANNRYAGQSYFAPAACVFSGMIWEKRKNTGKAITFYRQVSNYKDYPYKNSFDQKARAGLKRLSE
jgi:hypothetical protein